MDNETIVLELDRKTARLVLDALYVLGEHLAAGRPIEPLDTASEELIGAFMRELNIALGGSDRMA